MGKSMAGKFVLNYDDAQIIALNALTFLAADDDRIEAFIRISGTTPAVLRASAGDQAFLLGVLHYLLQNEALLLDFAQAHDIDPALPNLAATVLDPNPAL
ncbi:hypothetical protein BH10PSE7_BH10PSE7_09680 [soil metagenome]